MNSAVTAAVLLACLRAWVLEEEGAEARLLKVLIEAGFPEAAQSLLTRALRAWLQAWHVWLEHARLANARDRVHRRHEGVAGSPELGAYNDAVQKAAYVDGWTASEPAWRATEELAAQFPLLAELGRRILATGSEGGFACYSTRDAKKAWARWRAEPASGSCSGTYRVSACGDTQTMVWRWRELLGLRHLEHEQPKTIVSVPREQGKKLPSLPPVIKALPPAQPK